MKRGIAVRIRLAEESDGPQVLAWRNAPEVVPWMRSQRIVTAEEHQRWWVTRPPILIAELTREDPVGLIRIDPLAFNTPLDWRSLSVMVPANWQGQGIGWQLLDAAIGYARQIGVVGYQAVIARTNLPSRKLFSGRGFLLQTTPVLNEWLIYQLPLTTRL